MREKRTRRSARRPSAIFALAALAAAPLAALPPATARRAGAQSARSAGPPHPHGRVVADTLWSPSLGVRKQFVVYLPPSYDRDRARRFPVAYYLHGAGEDEWSWVQEGEIPAVADSLAARGAGEAIVVMPDGDDGWYTTWNALANVDACRRDTTRREPAATYCVPWPRYDEYVARDLVAKVDSAYRTRRGRAGRALAGLSMGGYGAVSLALRYPDVFGAAVSHSGVLAPLYIGPTPYARPARYAHTADEMRRLVARTPLPRRTAFGTDTAGWLARDPGRLAERARRAGTSPVPALYADVGTEDPLAAGTRAFRDRLAALGLPLAYREWPGQHDWSYWRAHAGDGLAWLLAQFRADSAAR